MKTDKTDPTVLVDLKDELAAALPPARNNLFRWPGFLLRCLVCGTGLGLFFGGCSVSHRLVSRLVPARTSVVDQPQVSSWDGFNR